MRQIHQRVRRLAATLLLVCCVKLPQTPANLTLATEGLLHALTLSKSLRSGVRGLPHVAPRSSCEGGSVLIRREPPPISKIKDIVPNLNIYVNNTNREHNIIQSILHVVPLSAI